MAYNDKLGIAIKESEFRQELEELIYITNKLRRQSITILITIIFSIISFAVFTYLHSYWNRLVSRDRISYNSSSYTIERFEFMDAFSWLITLGILMVGMIFLYQFFKIKKRGIVIYDELTDELDWSNKRKEYIKRPPIETRIIVKNFLQNTDLPFTNGQSGQVVYLIFFFLLIVATIIVKAI